MEIERYNNVFKYIVNKIKNNDNSDEIPLDISLEYYTFTENFFKYLGISQYSELLDHSNQALEYIDKTFPYCFMRIDNKTVDEAIKLYVLSLGKTYKEVPEIIEKLKNIKMQHISNQEIREKIDNSEMYEDKEYITINNIYGTSVKKYQLDNLYDVLLAINDKNINSYINYLIVNNIFNDEKQFQKIFQGMLVIKDYTGKQYISEGNHRIFTYLGLIKIREFLNISNECKEFKTMATVYKPVELSQTKEQRGK